MTESNALETLLQHAGKTHRVGKGLISAIEVATTFEPEFPGATPVYARLSNTKNHLEAMELVAALEGAEASFVFASGMAALNASCMQLLRAGDHVLVQENCYGSSAAYFGKILKRFDVSCDFAPIEKWEGAFCPNTRLAFFESISNPFCVPQDIERAVRLARKNNVTTLCDNTFASPYCCRPMDWGVDYVLESATKYLNGHSDVICGTIASSKKNVEALAQTAMYVGGFLPVQSVAQLVRGLRTFGIRMAAHVRNGEEFVNAIRSKPYVAEVFYATDDQKVARCFSGYAGMCAVRFSPSIKVTEMTKRLQYVKDVPSLGGTETTLCLPSKTTHFWMSEEERKALGVDDQLVRISVGLERVEDLVADIEMAISGN